ncbi:hypothetical protein FQA39_LY04214 [Lamprigera yunnana]|nr:hypothetical protein FQA39_LY04214 [Lamprigera yunnana]
MNLISGTLHLIRLAPALSKWSVLDSNLRSERHANVSKIEFDFSLLNNASELIICKNKLASLEGKLPTLTSSNRTRLLYSCLHVVQRLNRLEPSKSEGVLMSELLSKGILLLGVLDPEVLSGDESESKPAATADSTPVYNSISERDLVDRFAGLLDCTLQRLEKNRYCTGSIRKIGVTFSGTSDVHGILDVLGDVKEQSAVFGFSQLTLFEDAVELFTGPAIIWYRSIEDTVRSWNDLVEKLKTDFLPRNYDLSLWDEICSRKQGASESSIIDIATIRSLFARLKQIPSLDDQLTYTFANLLPSFLQLSLTSSLSSIALSVIILFILLSLSSSYKFLVL